MPRTIRRTKTARSLDTSNSRRKEKRERDSWKQEDWVYALRNAGDYSRYEFTLGPHPAVDFLNDLKHTGDFYGKPFDLRDWQEAIVRAVYRKDLTRRFLTLFLGLPRKNGKTEFVAGVGLLETFRPKPERRIYSASGDRDQAALLFTAAASMIGQNPDLDAAAHIYIGFKRINYDPMGSTYQAISSEAYTKHGLRPSVVLFDELHVFPNRDLYTVMMSAFGATSDPFTVMITTAGWDRESLCFEQWQYARDVRDGRIDDSDFFPVIYEAKEGDDWTSEEVWDRCMPALGDFCSKNYIRKECEKAQRLPAHQNEFKRLFLDIWTNQAERWISQEAWDACGEWFDHRELAGEQCYAGLDGAVSGDMFCYSLVFKYGEKIRILNHGFVPRDGRWRDEIRNKDRYERWEREGWLTYTPGNVIDDRVVEKAIVDWNEKYPVKSLFADKARVTSLLIRLLNDHNLPVKGIAQGPVSLNEACETLEKAVIAGQIEHRNDPILSWNIANAAVKRTTTGLIYPDKQSSTARIDGLSATINAFAAAIHDDENFGPSVYETRGPLWI